MSQPTLSLARLPNVSCHGVFEQPFPPRRPSLNPPFTHALLPSYQGDASSRSLHLTNLLNPSDHSNPGQVVRLQSSKGHDQLGIVQKHSGNPRSYIVNAQGTLYRRNRRHLLPVPEPLPQQQHLPDLYLPPQDPLPQPAIAQAPPP